MLRGESHSGLDFRRRGRLDPVVGMLQSVPGDASSEDIGQGGLPDTWGWPFLICAQDVASLRSRLLDIQDRRAQRKNAQQLASENRRQHHCKGQPGEKRTPLQRLERLDLNYTGLDGAFAGGRGKL